LDTFHWPATHLTKKSKVKNHQPHLLCGVPNAEKEISNNGKVITCQGRVFDSVEEVRNLIGKRFKKMINHTYF
jgi:hypothetical protein